MGQLEVSGKRLFHLKEELEACWQLYSSSSNQSTAAPSNDNTTSNPIGNHENELDETTLENISSLKKEIEKKLDVEIKKREGLIKLEAAKSPQKPSKSTNNLYSKEYQAIERSLFKLKEHLSLLNSNNHPAILKLLQKYNLSFSQLGHQFKQKQFYKITDCTVCHEALWGHKNQGLECSREFRFLFEKILVNFFFNFFRLQRNLS